ncbi:hypothetical protein [Flagellimonas algicola]|uniref:Uncharacterized protein n=1 Tax=Flagellimonas algicola TaxID=2583815 RepID=A0ABY2WFU4_9FLAO|nr:hypothetical protein [Allomuricauda algicola]TMU50423.1 hypothetical protein FGG15_19565 [Allomuricauda algicola]
MEKGLLVISIVLFFGCSDDGPVPRCYQKSGRRIVATVENVIGAIVMNELCGFIIDPNEQLDRNPIGILSPCNLSDEFEINGLRIIFSGYIYESFETEDICADFFEITEIMMAEVQ